MSEHIDPFLTPFPQAVAAVAQRAVASGATVVPPDPALQQFRLAPAEAVARVSSHLAALWRDPSRPDAVVWCLSGDPGCGLEAEELAALLERSLHIDVATAIVHDGVRRVLVVGTLRHEHVSVSVTAPPAAAGAVLEEWLTTLASNGTPTTAFVTMAQAESLGASEDGRRGVTALMHADGGLALWVPEGQAAAATDAVDRIAEAFRALTGLPPAIVRFADGPSLPAQVVHTFMARVGAAVDSSMQVATEQPGGNHVVRLGPYAGSAPYYPQMFDLRVPLVAPAPHAWVELAPVPATAGTVEAAWTQLLGPGDGFYAERLDNPRIERFFRLAQVQPEIERTYPSVRVYNPPPSAPAERLTLLDGGTLDAVGVNSYLAAVNRLLGQGGPRMHRVRSAELAARAAREAHTRYATSSTDAIALQNDLHGYLATVPQDAPLREDYADFARFAPAELGDTLEIGSGYGLLAWTLAPRARRYTCLDLDVNMFRTLRRDLRQAGVVADMHHLPFADQSFDSIIANNVVEHLYDPLAGLREFRRVLRPGGRLIALVPFDAIDERHALLAHHWKLDEQGLRAAVTAADLDLARLEIINLYDLGVAGAFPTCRGLEGKFDAVRPLSDGAPRRSRPATEARTPRRIQAAGRAGARGVRAVGRTLRRAHRQRRR